jgi:hypothetical protein
VVAYEADSLDLTARQGWTVIVIGLARLESEAAALRYRAELRPWLAGAMTGIISISAEMVTGYRLFRLHPQRLVVPLWYHERGTIDPWR